LFEISVSEAINLFATDKFNCFAIFSNSRSST
jgi:hypothetical protein